MIGMVKDTPIKRKRRPYAIVLDYDDTVVNFIGFLCTIHNHINGTCITGRDIINWGFKDINMKDARGNTVTGADLDKTFKDWESNGLYASLPAFKDARRAIELMRKLGYKIIIVTARDEKYRKETELNAMHQHIHYDELHFSQDKVKTIRELNKTYNIKMFADDKAVTVLDIADKCRIKYTFIIDQEHNKYIDDDEEDIIRIKDIMEAIRYLPDVNPKH